MEKKMEHETKTTMGVRVWGSCSRIQGFNLHSKYLGAQSGSYVGTLGPR